MVISFNFTMMRGLTNRKFKGCHGLDSDDECWYSLESCRLKSQTYPKPCFISTKSYRVIYRNMVTQILFGIKKISI
jgi:hypothetical protein